jgi:hypothetical protein
VFSILFCGATSKTLFTWHDASSSGLGVVVENKRTVERCASFVAGRELLYVVGERKWP